eukprot:1002604-Amphidinium_carterae.1
MMPSFLVPYGRCVSNSVSKREYTADKEYLVPAAEGLDVSCAAARGKWSATGDGCTGNETEVLGDTQKHPRGCRIGVG